MAGHYAFILAASLEAVKEICQSHVRERRIKGYSEYSINSRQVLVHFRENITREYLRDYDCQGLPTAYIDREGVYFSKTHHLGPPTDTPDIVARKMAVLPAFAPLFMGVIQA